MSIVKTMITQKDFQPKILPHILSIRLSSRGKKSKIGSYKLYCYMFYKAKKTNAIVKNQSGGGNDFLIKNVIKIALPMSVLLLGWMALKTFSYALIRKSKIG